jgi:hypothetical protein
MSCGRTRRVCRVSRKKTEKDLKAARITGRPIHFAGLDESASLGDISKMVRNLEIQFWNKSCSRLVNTNRGQIAPNVEGRSKRYLT